jgi:Cd(II)/Pb(II)-responsive transcriptional regulator
MKIGELARLTQCTVETVRYYEREGLLPVATRTEGNFRAYGPEHIERLRFIRNCRALDMSHEEIRNLLGMIDTPAAGCGAINEVFDEHITHVEARIRELEELKQSLRTLRDRCQSERSVNDCGILHGLTEMGSAPRKEKHTHLG